jgi:hypothetical protein
MIQFNIAILSTQRSSSILRALTHATQPAQHILLDLIALIIIICEAPQYAVLSSTIINLQECEETVTAGVQAMQFCALHSQIRSECRTSHDTNSY